MKFSHKRRRGQEPQHEGYATDIRNSAEQLPVIEAAKRKRVTLVLHIELAAIVVILLCAAIMARGGWV
jgi:putative membrane protein